MKIVIANSIGIDRNNNFIIHSPSRWTQGVKNRYQWFAYYPWELAYLSSMLKKNTGHKVKLIDGCLGRLNYNSYLNKIIAEKPDFLIIESATRVINDNLRLAMEVKQKLGTKLVFTGAHATAMPEDLLNAGVDYVCTGEYEYTVLDIISGKSKDKITGLHPNARRELLDINSLPWPEDDDISRFSYAVPGEPSSEYKEIQMYASRGCPGNCNFCVARHLYYNQPNWRMRNIKDIIAEIKHLKKKYPVMQGVFFDEETHNANKNFILGLTRAIKDNGLDTLHYEAMCDIRFLDDEVMQAMFEAGYYKIRVGIESASEQVLKQMGKNLDITEVEKKLMFARRIGLKTYGTFTFGALGATEQEDMKTVNLIKKLILNDMLNNLQISICTPQPGTPFYQEAIKNRFLVNADFNKYDGGSCSVVSYPKYDYRQILKLAEKAYLSRDYYYWLVKLKSKEIFAWIKGIYRKYGFWETLNKAVFRIFKNLKYKASIKW